ncbi:hypothetical protein [Mesorhizobium sp. ISC11]|uniref:hypothetical protein n=1 Tax=Mesorhizobium sp. ISC11 TaxID=3076428 RepID=UPI00301B87AE
MKKVSASGQLKNATLRLRWGAKLPSAFEPGTGCPLDRLNSIYSIEISHEEERIERALDRVAEIIVAPSDQGEEWLPLYDHLERAMQDLQAKEKSLVAVRGRAKRAQGRAKARSRTPQETKSIWLSLSSVRRFFGAMSASNAQ